MKLFLIDWGYEFLLGFPDMDVIQKGCLPYIIRNYDPYNKIY